MNYIKQAQDFLQSTGTTFKAEFLKYNYYFADDTAPRDIYLITLQRGCREYTFNFGQSVANSGFYAQQGVQKIPIDRKYLKVSDIQIWRARTKYGLSFRLGHDRIHRPTAPTEYDVLSCLTHYDPYTLEDFCDCYGYDTDSIRANELYKDVVNEWQNVCILWSDEEIEILREIS